MNRIAVTVVPSATKKCALVSRYLSRLNYLRNTLVPVQHIKKNPIREFTPAHAATKHAGAKIGKSIEAAAANARMKNMISKYVKSAFRMGACNISMQSIETIENEKEKEKT